MFNFDRIVTTSSKKSLGADVIGAEWLFCVASTADFCGVDPPFTAEVKVLMGWLWLAAGS